MKEIKMVGATKLLNLCCPINASEFKPTSFTIPPLSHLSTFLTSITYIHMLLFFIKLSLNSTQI